MEGAMRQLLLCLPLLALGLPLGACSFDRYDGRWVADVPPGRNCCPTRIVMDIDGHKVRGSAEDCHGVDQISGKIDAQGTARISLGGAPGNVSFAGENFQALVPGDACKRQMVGNRGG